MDIRTHRMTLRRLAALDVANLYTLDQDPKVRRYIDAGKPPEAWPIYQEKTLLKIDSFSVYGPDLGFWSAHLADDTFLGRFHLRPTQIYFLERWKLAFGYIADFGGKDSLPRGAESCLKSLFPN